MVAQAARNNALWCDAVCRANDMPGATGLAPLDDLRVWGRNEPAQEPR